MKNAIAYIRASTNPEMQENSIEIQAAIIERFAETNGYIITDTFVEYQSGGNDERAEFNKALAHINETNATLICWKVDRLARTMSVFAKISHLLPSIRFAELGDIEPNIMVLGVLLGVATQERINTSVRVKATYNMLKAKDPNKAWGNPRILETATPLGLAVRKSNAHEYNTYVQGIVADLKSAGYCTLNDIAVRLNQLGIKTRRGADFKIHNLHRVLNYGGQNA
jgi:DNA invertase Pin-like site-specific DNA recombinase